MKRAQQVALLLLVLGAALFCFFNYTGQLRFVQPESRLGFLETRIASVEAEFMRRSPELRDTFTEFRLCMKQPGCNTAPILAKRDSILAKKWPELLLRLAVSDDWGEGSQTTLLHERFRADVREAGGMKKAKNCRPLIRFYQLSGSQEILSLYKGLRCPTPDPA